MSTTTKAKRRKGTAKFAPRPAVSRTKTVAPLRYPNFIDLGLATTAVFGLCLAILAH